MGGVKGWWGSKGDGGLGVVGSRGGWSIEVVGSRGSGCLGVEWNSDQN